MKDNVSKTGKNVLHDILFILRKNILWMLIIIATASAIGVAWAYVRKPEYIANQEINYFVKEEGSAIDAPPNTVEINTMNGYVETIIEFCTTENVLDLANVYYIMYKSNTQDLDTFIAQEKAKQKPQAVYRGKNSHFSASNIKTYSFSKDNDITGFVFAISYQANEVKVAQEKVRILALACHQEAKDCIPGIVTYLEELGFDAGDYTVDVTKPRIVMIAFIVGVVAAIVFVFLRNLLDNTIKTKEDLERLTGATVFACIEDRDALNKPYGKTHKSTKGVK